MIFYLGAPEPSWLSRARVPLFVSRERLNMFGRKSFPKAAGPWALDSGGFKHLEKHGRWVLDPKDYVREVRIAAEKIGKLQWAAIMDYMCEPPIIYGGPTDPGSVAVGTGLSVEEHQLRTIESYCRLRELGGRDMAHLWAPVLQGWCVEDYLEHVHLWSTWGKVDLREAPVVGVGSVCRRQGTEMASALFRILTEQFPLEGRLHAFGSKTLGLQLAARVGKVAVPDLYAGWGADALAAGWPQSAVERAMLYATEAGPSTWEESDVEVCRLLQSSDSMAWSVVARNHGNGVRGLRDDLWGRNGWGQRGDTLYAGGRASRGSGRRSSYEGGTEVGRVRPELAGQKHSLAPTQMLVSCAESYARGETGKSHLSCSNCLTWALTWRKALLSKLLPECRSTTPPPRPKITETPICGLQNRADVLANMVAQLAHDEVRAGRVDHAGRERLRAMYKASLVDDKSLLPLQTGFERMEKPRPKPWVMPEAELCRAWGTGRQRWGEARIVRPGAPEAPPLPSPWQPWPAAEARRLLEAELKKPRKKGPAVDLPPVDTGLRDALFPPVDTGLRDALRDEDTP